LKRKDVIKKIKDKKRNEQKKTKNDFLYKVDQNIYYLGKLYEDYQYKSAIIKSRSTEKKFYKFYIIEFEDGFELRVKETWITDKLEKDSDNNENN